MNELINRIVGQLTANPIGAWTGTEAEKAVEKAYLNMLRNTYIRTLTDISGYFQETRQQFSNIQIIEFGTYLGVVSRALVELGFQVTASDFPKIFENARVRQLFRDAGVKLHPQDLACRMECLESDFFDGVIMCETLEHLPFNPVPLLDELNRMLKPGGLLYLTVPNIASLRNRVLLLCGQSICNPIADFFEQLRPNSPMTVGLHWREYTKAELEAMLGGLGFQFHSTRYYDIPGPKFRSGLGSLVKKSLLALFPALSSTVVVMAKKAARSNPKEASHIGKGTLELARSS